VKLGEVALVRFPFADFASAKKRPALVLARTARSPRNRLATVAMITSQVEALALPGDVLLADWKAAGLLHPSLLRLAKVATIDERLIDRTIGRLSPHDLAAAREAFRRVFTGWI
jgi:mRNA interferase MazF